MAVDRRKLGEILVDQGVIGPGQLKAALEAQAQGARRRMLGEVLVEQGAASDTAIAEALAVQAGLPFCDPLKAAVDPGLLWRVPRKTAEAHRALVLHKTPRGIRVAMADAKDQDAISDLEFTLKATVLVELAAESAIRQAIHRHYDLEPQAQSILQEVPPSMRPPVTSPTSLELDRNAIQDRLKQGGNAYVEMVNFLLVNAIERNASDIHFEPGSEGVRIRYRIDGLLREVLLLPTWAQKPLTNRIKVAGRMDVADHRRPQDGRAVAELGRRRVDLRISTVPSQFGESVAIRLLDSKTVKTDLGALGWNPRTLGTYFSLVSQHQGLLLVVGPTGSGKTTTLYASINRLKAETSAIVTIEDPIEHTVAGISQVQVDEKAGLTFANIARSLLRQDPNVLVIGEIRDAESAAAAVDAATTGHLVLSTMHTTNAVAAVTRLRDLAVPNYLVAHALLGIVSQRLVRRLCPVCSEAGEPDQEEWERLGVRAESLGGGSRRVGVGCPSCQYSGYRGRVGLFEVLRVDESVRKQILDGASEAEVLTAARANGMSTLLDDALEKLRDGTTTLEEVIRVTPIDGGRERARKAPVSFGSEPVRPTSSMLPTKSPLVASASRAEAPAPAATVPAVDEPTEGEPKAAPVPAERPRVVVADDADEILMLVRATLEDGFDVSVARDGVEALEVIARDRPDVVVLDVMMPHLSGYEVCKRLKASPETESLPVLILSARGDTAHVKEGFQVGADDYLPKPFDPEELELRLRALMRRAGRVRR
jgi:type IV pilus assembly protein PilB